MALPGNVLSSEAYYAAWLNVSRGPGDVLKDYELAGVAIQDGTQGMQVKVWTGRVVNEKREVQVSAPGVPWTTLFVRANQIKEIAIAFDNNMNPFVVFKEENDASFIYWFDPVDNTQKFTALPAGVNTPRCCIDDHRRSQSAVSDVVLAYVRAGNLYVRYQRDRYQTERLLQAGVGTNAKLIEVGLNKHFRLQFWFKNANNIPGAKQFGNPLLSDIVYSLCRIGGLEPENIDVEDLQGVEVIGYKCNTDDGLNKRIDALREVFIFDKAEVDKKIRFVRRGQPVVARIPYVDLVADDPSALKRTLIQEKELPKSVTVNHLDPAGGFANNKQTAFRRSNLISATKQEKLESEVVLTADQGMTAATVKLKIAWHEQQTFQFATMLKYAFVVPTSVVEVEDKDGDWHRIRVTERNDDHPIIKFEGVQDAGQDVYETLGVGKSLPPPVSTTPGEVGETLLEIFNGPVMRDQDDEVGVYVAAKGTGKGWYGYSLMVSTDGGIDYEEAYQSTALATVGITETVLLADNSYQYQGQQSVVVNVNNPLESISYNQQLQGGNVIVIGDEVLSFRIATLLETGDDFYRYRLSGLVRAKYGTQPLEWEAGTRFFVFDSAVNFVQVQSSMIGTELVCKPVSFGATIDETVPTHFDFDEVNSQTEWPVAQAQATIDPQGNVKVQWIGCGRLGTDSAPRHSKYFRGFRVVYSDGVTVDTLESEHYRTGVALDLDNVQIAALNEFTGPGLFVTVEPVEVPKVDIPRVVIDGGEVQP